MTGTSQWTQGLEHENTLTLFENLVGLQVCFCRQQVCSCECFLLVWDSAACRTCVALAEMHQLPTCLQQASCDVQRQMWMGV